MARPVIGISTSARSGWRIFPLIALSVLIAGGRPRWFRVGHSASIDGVDGLIAGGGDDISADLYGGRIMAEARIDPARDALERWLIGEALSAGKPVLGICRGAQMLNIVRGGALHQDITEAYVGAKRMWTVLPKKTVAIEPGSRLAAIMGCEPAQVNALHSQSVSRVGHGLAIAARDGWGIVQAIEATDDPFAVGVQWHPEHLFYARRQRRLFAALVAACRDRAGEGAAPQPAGDAAQPSS